MGAGGVFATPNGSSYNAHSDTAFTFLRKLESYDLSGNMLEWFLSFFELLAILNFEGLQEQLWPRHGDADFLYC